VRLAPATIAEWRLLVAADASGRPPLPPADPGAPVAELAARIGAAAGRPQALLTGRDLLDLGLAPGPRIGQLLREAYAAQIEGAFESREEGLRWLAQRIEQRS
jgi:tRNA nucleotidyltransferase (CCA-adding enzyme)